MKKLTSILVLFLFIFISGCDNQFDVNQHNLEKDIKQKYEKKFEKKNSLKEKKIKEEQKKIIENKKLLKEKNNLEKKEKSKDEIENNSQEKTELKKNNIPKFNLKNLEKLDFETMSKIAHTENMDFEINSEISKNFEITELENFEEILNAYEIKLSDKEKNFFEKNKFLILDVVRTNIKPKFGHEDASREFWAFYNKISGSAMPADRKPENALFWSSDIFMHSYQILFTEILKEMENKIFFPAMKKMSKVFFEKAEKNFLAAKNLEEKKSWKKIRNYFAVPYAILELGITNPKEKDFRNANGGWKDPKKINEKFEEQDKKNDKLENAILFLDKLNLEKEEKDIITKDLEQIFKASTVSIPKIFEPEYKKCTKETGIEIKIDFSQFTPRSHYTSSSLRRSYFRAMKWFIEVPFLLNSPELTDYALNITQLFAENPEELKNYNDLERTINFMVGASDDLMPVDYLLALQKSQGSDDPEKIIIDYLIKTKDPQIKGHSATFSQPGEFSSEETKLATKGMRFFSAKFIIDSFWTDYLTQGDEDIQEGYTQKLPPMSSSLQVMSLLGSDYAKTQIKNLDFYNENNQEAINQALKELEEKNIKLDNQYWQKNIYNGWLWVIKGVFDFEKNNKNNLPFFMKNKNWDIKTLMTNSSFWSELRHATLLYAKSSFAEMGGGAGDCKPIPEPPKGYIEPNLKAYQRLLTLAKRIKQGILDLKFPELKTIRNIDSFISAIEMVIDYSEKELKNNQLSEKIVNATVNECEYQKIEGESDWEKIRTYILSDLRGALPEPLEGPVLEVKDQRTAIVADIHTGMDSQNPPKILYEGVGVPKVIIVAVKDINGARATIGFVYSHYEFTKPLGGPRLTDEEWQENFYQKDSAENLKPKEGWPKEPFWYDPILDLE